MTKYFNDDIFKLIMVACMQDLGSLNSRDLFFLTYCHSKHSFDKLKHIEDNKHLYYKRATKILR